MIRKYIDLNNPLELKMKKTYHMKLESLGLNLTIRKSLFKGLANN